MLQSTQWARLRADANVQLRRGAWYRVVRLTPLEAVLDAGTKQVNVPKAYLQIVPGRPGSWSIVPRPPHSLRLPLSWGPRYAVCPSCRERAPLLRGTASMSCPRCHGVFEVGWGDAS